MKFIRVSIYVLIGFTIVFFAIGLVNPKVKYSVTVQVNKSLPETFALFNNIDSLTKWLPEIKEIETLVEKPGIVGSKYKMVIDSQGDTMSIYETVTSYKKNEHVGLEFNVGIMTKTDSIVFVSHGNATEITGLYSCTGSNLFYKSMFSFLKGSFRDIDLAYLNKFKAVAENQH